MTAYLSFKLLHLFGVLLLFSSLGAQVALAAAGKDSAAIRRASAVGHGIALGLILLAGLGLMVNLEVGGAVPFWILLKLVIWLLFGAVIVLVRRAESGVATLLLFLLPLLGAFSAYLALFKPGP